MKLLKKNQIIVYTIAVLLMVAGYLNYSTNHKEALETSSQEIESINEYANVGDARLVSSNDIAENTNTSTNNNTNTDNIKTTAPTTENATNENKNKNETNTNSKDITTQTSSEVSDEYFVKSKLERDTMYSQMLESYENVLNGINR